MKTTISNISILNNAKLLSMITEGVDNITDMFILTQIEDVSKFNTNDYFGDDGIISGCSYVSNQYSYGNTEVIKNVMNNLINKASKFQSLCEDDELMECYFILFDVGNGKSMLVTNVVELFATLDIDFDDALPGELNIVCGSIADDNDISTIMTQALMVIPKTKGFKVPGSTFFDLNEETTSYIEFEEYFGTWFSDTNSLKTGNEWFDFFKAINSCVVLNNQFNFGYNHTQSIDEVSFIIKQYESTQTISDDVELIYKSGKSHKFFNVYIDNDFVCTEYGAVGKTSTSTDKSFNSIEEATEFMKKKVISKIKSGYVMQ